VSYYLYDFHSGVRQLANATGQITATYTYDAFGNLIAQTGTTPNTHLYRGEVFDIVTGLYDLRARYMDTATGRFASTDPYAGDLSLPITLNRYLYASVDPVNSLDPSGRFSFVTNVAILNGIILLLSANPAYVYIQNVY
jgi:RHS repeat-associated protein